MSVPLRRTWICRERKDAIDAFSTLAGYNWGEAVDITIGRHRPRRSIKQNNRFHAWCDILADELGNESYDKERMKAELKVICECPETEYVGLDGEIRTERSTKRLDTVQMAQFEDRVWRFAITELGIELPMTRKEEKEPAHAG